MMRKSRHANDNERVGLKFGPETVQEMLAEKIEAWNAFWNRLVAEKRVNRPEDYANIFDRPKTARIIRLSPSRKNRWQ